MAYANRPMENVNVERRPTGVVEFGDRVHWGAIFAGLVIALSTQLLLSAIGVALGFTTIANSGAPRSDADNVGAAVGIWSIISLFISLFVGGWVTAKAAGSISKSTASLNGAILWATTMAISAWLLASGVSGAFGIALSNAGNITNQVQQNGVSLPNLNPGMANPGMPNSGTQQNGGTQQGQMPQVPTPSAQQTRDIAGNGAKAGWGFTFGALLGLSAAMIGATVGAKNARAYVSNTTTEI
jgi:hypothetical protein